ncbi:hypothetical protein [Yersinia pestis]|uniref:hypothetical protein n=1 Tax=Yersinia pestis TaxID=632 RepID=UPI00345CD8D3
MDEKKLGYVGHIRVSDSDSEVAANHSPPAIIIAIYHHNNEGKDGSLGCHRLKQFRHAALSVI